MIETVTVIKVHYKLVYFGIPESVKRPLGSGWLLKYLLQKSADSKATKTTYPKK